MATGSILARRSERRRDERQRRDAADLEDAALVARVRHGSADALSTLYDRHAGGVFAAVVRATNDRAVADDVVQDTFLALWDRAELFDPNRGSLHAWLLTIARNRSIDHLRAARRRPTSAFSAFDDAVPDDASAAEWLTAVGRPVAMAAPEPDPQLVAARRDTNAWVLDGLAALGPRERCVLLLAYAEGLTQSEIAERLGLPLGTVKTRTRRALARLRDRLEDPQTRSNDRASRAGRRLTAASIAAACASTV